MQSLQEVLDDHADVFKEELGTLQGVEVPVRIKSEAQPHFYRPRPVPYSMRQKVENELTRLQEQEVSSLKYRSPTGQHPLFLY